MKIGILGAGGQLGTALIDLCQFTHIAFEAPFHRDLDITDFQALRRFIEKTRITHLINCAAYTDVDGAEEHSKKAYAVNAGGPENLGRLAQEFPLHVVHVSTDYVFDGQKETPYVETDKTNPLGIYGKSKLEGEERLFDLCPSACIVRTSWIFGQKGTNFISSVLSLLQSNESLHVVEDQVNRATFNKDLAKALLDLSCHSGLFHFANHGPVSRFQIVQDFYEEAKNRGLPIRCQKISPISIRDFPSRSPRPPYSVLDTSKVEGVLGRKPRMWKTILGDYFDHVAKSL